MNHIFHFLVRCSLLCATCFAAHATGPNISNVIIGGGERRCSSFSGAQQSRDCSADWATIVREDQAFQGMALEDLVFSPDYEAHAFTYSLTDPHILAFQASPDRLFDAQRKRALIAQLRTLLQSQGPQTAITWGTLLEALTRNNPTLLQSLTSPEWAVLRTALVDATPVARRKIQGRSIRFSSNAASVAIAQAFVDAARRLNNGNTPLIAVVTASAGPHPFVDHDINVMGFKSAGANVVYLPLEGGFRQALDAQDCVHTPYYYAAYANTNPERLSYHSDLLFPDLAALQQTLCANDARELNATLGRVHGIYFSGGNQARHLESLVSKDAQGIYSIISPQLQIIAERHARGDLVVGGTSAGNHIQGGGLWKGKPVPMLGGGDSYPVLQQGFKTGQGPIAELPELGTSEDTMVYAPSLYPRGGLGVFRFGVLDSHFSRRAREGRLIRATVDSAMDYGFGVDENTALLVTQPDAQGTTHFSVVGAAGVFIADTRKAQPASNLPPGAWRVRGIRAHYLQPKDTATIDRHGDLQVTLWSGRPVLPAMTQAPAVAQDRLLDYGGANFLRLSKAMALAGATSAQGTTQNSQDKRSVQNKPGYRADLARSAHTIFRGNPSAGDALASDISYTQLEVSLEPLTPATHHDHR